MSTIEKRFRRNFIVASIVHVAIIGGIVIFEGIFSSARSNVPATTELIIPADILGDQPTGPGSGRGNYTAPAPEPAAENTGAPAAPSAPAAKPAEPVAPKPAAAPPEAKDPNEILIPKKAATKEIKKPADTTAKKTVTTDKAADKTADKSTTTPKKTVADAKSSAKTGSTGPAVSADTIRKRFASALSSAEGGTPYGDNRPAGGGNGASKYGHPGSPDGAADGIAGGVGKGSQFWSYYMHVHDKMYEAWDQPGQAKSVDKKLVTTLILHVARDGRIEGVRLERPSGNKLMDDSVMTAAHSVPRLDPLPEGLGGDFAEISVNFRLEG
ncbi:MAG TPA: TonB C-terminal domain-containing protein [Verrucomicrobiae bacterium]|nr:TonB C-terminal domain-containing protein [Verrucomicrobiae bacterium]